jgi:hypothetical protein
VLRRHFSRKRAVDVRRINPKVPKEEAVAISERLLQILSDHGPLTVVEPRQGTRTNALLPQYKLHSLYV